MASTSSTPSSSPSDQFRPTEWTQHTMLSDVMQQKGLLIGLGVVVGFFVLILRRRAAPQEQAARRLVRDWRKVDAEKVAESFHKEVKLLKTLHC